MLSFWEVSSREWKTEVAQQTDTLQTWSCSHYSPLKPARTTAHLTSLSESRMWSLNSTHHLHVEDELLMMAGNLTWYRLYYHWQKYYDQKEREKRNQVVLRAERSFLIGADTEDHLRTERSINETSVQAINNLTDNLGQYSAFFTAICISFVSKLLCPQPTLQSLEILVYSTINLHWRLSVPPKHISRGDRRFYITDGRSPTLHFEA